MTPSPYLTPSQRPFKSAHGRARIVKILLIVGAIAAGISIVAETLSLAFPFPTEEQELSDNPVGTGLVFFMLGLALIEFFIYVATVVLFCMWLYRAYDNLSFFNPGRPLDASPGWAVGSFFIPFVNLVVPYRAVREVWQKSWPPDETLLSAPSPPAWFPIWWAFWLAAGIVGNISMRLTFNESVDESTATTISIIASGLSIFAAIFAYMVVTEIDKRQEETGAKTQLGNLSGPPPPPTNMPYPNVVSPTV
jgi:hypothetical protein